MTPEQAAELIEQVASIRSMESGIGVFVGMITILLVGILWILLNQE